MRWWACSIQLFRNTTKSSGWSDGEPRKYMRESGQVVEVRMPASMVRQQRERLPVVKRG